MWLKEMKEASLLVLYSNLKSTSMVYLWCPVNNEEKLRTPQYYDQYDHQAEVEILI